MWNNWLDQIIIYDLETFTPTGKPDKTKDIIRWIGFRCKDKHNIYQFPRDKAKIKNYLRKHRGYTYAGHNIKDRQGDWGELGYDNHIMRRHGFDEFSKYNKYIDTQYIMEKRASEFLYWKLGKGDFSLRSLAKRCGLPVQKGDIDYKIFKKRLYNYREKQEIIKYLKGDLDTTYELLKYFGTLFLPFTNDIVEENIKNFSWLDTSLGTQSYKVFCKVSEVPEIYAKVGEFLKIAFKGGFIWTKNVDRADNVLVFDFASLYPMMAMLGNLYNVLVTPQERKDITEAIIKKDYSKLKYDDDRWSGGSYYKTVLEDPINGIIGKYNKEPSKYGLFLFRKFHDRKYYKKEMKRYLKGTDSYNKWYSMQLVAKLNMNGSYGATGNGKFASMYDIITARDIPAMGRQSNLGIKRRMEEEGYNVTYCHTDSNHVSLPNLNANTINHCINAVNDEVQKQINSGNNKILDIHNMELEEVLKYEYYFRDDNGKILKARNLAIPYDLNPLYKKYGKDALSHLDEAKVGTPHWTGAKRIRIETSAYAKWLIDEKLLPQLIEGRPNIFFDIEYLKDLIRNNIKIEMMSKKFKIKPLNTYKSKTAIQYLIGKEYGEGEHYLVKNTFKGVGKSVKYCKLDELKQEDNWEQYVDMSQYLNDLKDFIEPKFRKSKYMKFSINANELINEEERGKNVDLNSFF